MHGSALEHLLLTNRVYPWVLLLICLPAIALMIELGKRFVPGSAEFGNGAVKKVRLVSWVATIVSFAIVKIDTTFMIRIIVALPSAIFLAYLSITVWRGVVLVNRKRANNQR